MPILMAPLMAGLLCCCRDSKFDKITSSSFEIKTKSGDVAVSGNFPVVLSMCNITYITTTQDYRTLLVNVHNGYTSDSRTIQRRCVVCQVYYLIQEALTKLGFLELLTLGAHAQRGLL